MSAPLSIAARKTTFFQRACIIAALTAPAVGHSADVVRQRLLYTQALADHVDAQVDHQRDIVRGLHALSERGHCSQSELTSASELLIRLERRSSAYGRFLSFLDQIQSPTETKISTNQDRSSLVLVVNVGSLAGAEFDDHLYVVPASIRNTESFFEDLRELEGHLVATETAVIEPRVEYLKARIDRLQKIDEPLTAELAERDLLKGQVRLFETELQVIRTQMPTMQLIRGHQNVDIDGEVVSDTTSLLQLIDKQWRVALKDAAVVPAYSADPAESQLRRLSLELDRAGTQVRFFRQRQELVADLAAQDSFFSGEAIWLAMAGQQAVATECMATERLSKLQLLSDNIYQWSQDSTSAKTPDTELIRDLLQRNMKSALVQKTKTDRKLAEKTVNAMKRLHREGHASWSELAVAEGNLKACQAAHQAAHLRRDIADRQIAVFDRIAGSSDEATAGVVSR